jgi:predicted transport protein
MNKPLDPQTQTMIDNLPVKTGKSLTEWYRVISDAKLEKHGDILKLLKGEYEVTHGFANTISIFYRQQLSGGAPSEEDLINEQYQGAKAGLRSVFEAIISAVSQLGSDVEIAPKKTYVSLRRNKQFAIVQAATKSRVDLGFNLVGVDPTDRLEGGNVFSGMCTHKIRLTLPTEVDDKVVSWLKQAYDQS